MNPWKKQKILEAAENLFNKFGIKKTAIDEISNHANVSKGTIYNYFGNKEGILRELIKKKINLFDDKIEKIFDTIMDPFTRLKISLTEHLKILINNPFLSDKMLCANDRSMFVIDELDKKARGIINRILDSAITDEPIADKNIIINTILFTLKGIEHYITDGLDTISIKPVEKEIDYLLQLIFSKYNMKFETDGS